ncbi:hypothetical protein CEXT_271561 [Caerostris extrusa]|uniref:Uncharacterized protein n=1 Tax=Caerostris extrusa TaxID=172846 RepID=A0AAV4NHR0_CAEEX|nr:hypothetical protein CEXT_271561 [Caerostris extrusa]
MSHLGTSWNNENPGVRYMWTHTKRCYGFMCRGNSNRAIAYHSIADYKIHQYPQSWQVHPFHESFVISENVTAFHSCRHASPQRGVYNIGGKVKKKIK